MLVDDSALKDPGDKVYHNGIYLHKLINQHIFLTWSSFYVYKGLNTLKVTQGTNTNVVIEFVRYWKWLGVRTRVLY